jgi:hypothetical protein
VCLCGLRRESYGYRLPGGGGYLRKGGGLLVDTVVLAKRRFLGKV